MLAVNRNEKKLWGLATERSSTWRKVLQTVYLPHQDTCCPVPSAMLTRGLFLPPARLLWPKDTGNHALCYH